MKDISILCVEDNDQVAWAIEAALRRAVGVLWLGRLDRADGVTARAAADEADIIVMDLDMPGLSPFAAMADLRAAADAPRVIVFSGHLSEAVVDRVIEAGAWGCVAKSDGEDALLAAIRRVAGGEFVLSPAVRGLYG